MREILEFLYHLRSTRKAFQRVKAFRAANPTFNLEQVSENMRHAAAYGWEISDRFYGQTPSEFPTELDASPRNPFMSETFKAAPDVK